MRLLDELRVLASQSRRASELASRRQIVALAVAMGIMALTSASHTGVALLLGSLVDHVKDGLSAQQSRGAILGAAAWTLAIISLLYLGRELLHVVRRNLVDRVLAGLNRNLLSRLVDHVLHWEMHVFGQEKVGALHGKVMRSVEGMVRFVRLLFLDCLPAALTGLFALSAAMTKSPLLGLAMIGVVPLSVWLTLRQLQSQRDIRLKLMRDVEEIDGAIVEQLNSAEYLRVANTYDLESQRLARVAERKQRREMKHHFAMSLYGCGKALNEGGFHVLVLALATWLAVTGRISFGDILVFSVLFLNVMTPLNEIHRILDEGHESSLRVADYFQMMETPADRSFFTKGSPGPRTKERANAIEVRDLVVEYQTPDGLTHRALDGVSLRIEHGETVGIAGRSGCGKSTLVKALLRLVHPTSGEILLGGVSLAEMSREEIANVVGYVGQIPFAISGSLLENITYGSTKCGTEEAMGAAMQAQLHSDVLLLPQSYATDVGERGQNLSGGQRQRLAIARILLRGAPILILDEATSALDNISERRIQESLGVHSLNRTTIMVAHRLSTLRECSQILVFDEGRIVEVGDYESLVQAGGIFSMLVRSAEERSPVMEVQGCV